MMPGLARYIEVWNGSWQGNNPVEHTKNEDGLALWYRWLNEGRRLIATAGSDAHGPSHYDPGCGFNVIHAAALTAPDILAGLRVGRLYLSAGPTLDLRAAAGDHHAMIGDTLTVAGHQEIDVRADWSAVPGGASARLVVNGAVQAVLPIAGEGQVQWTLPAYGTHWCTVELRAANGEMLAVANPVFISLA
jgi:hypothetical protein